jgi:Ala-tRNA(Pro) deacylase
MAQVPRQCKGPRPGFFDPWRDQLGALQASPLRRHSRQGENLVPLTRSELFAQLDAMGIASTTIEHEALYTVEQSSVVEKSLPGAHTKNLFLKDEDGTLLLVVAKTTTKIDLKSLGKRLGYGRFSFGKPELMESVLGITPGSVTAFAIANDTEKRVHLIFDAELMAHDSLNCHPLENIATTNIARDDLLRFIRATGHEPRIMTLSGA